MRYTDYSTLPANALLERLANPHPAGPGRWRATCPAHGTGRNQALSIRVVDGKILLHCFAGCDSDAVLAALGLSWRDLHADTARPWSPPPVRVRATATAAPDADRRRYLERLWVGARPIRDAEVGRRYLAARGLAPERVLEGLHLRVHPALEYHMEGGVLGTYPALLGRVEHPRHGLVALHRTYLMPDGSGKAPVPSPKKLTPPVFQGATIGGAIRLFQPRPGEPLALTEGVETALAVHQAARWPVWACISAGGLAAVLLPAEAGEVVICGDADAAGLEAAGKLACRLLAEGRRVRVAVPPVPGTDWLDALAAEGVAV
jgi:putative DNA primase/helicase